MVKMLFFYGCILDTTQSIWTNEWAKTTNIDSLSTVIPGVNINLFKNLDATFPPGAYTTVGKYNECLVPPFRIVAWWDKSVDPRMGGNSALIGYGFPSAEEMLDEGARIFPSVFGRQERPVKFEG